MYLLNTMKTTMRAMTTTNAATKTPAITALLSPLSSAEPCICIDISSESENKYYKTVGMKSTDMKPGQCLLTDVGMCSCISSHHLHVRNNNKNLLNCVPILFGMNLYFFV